jgi:hypothetical protein
VTAPSRKSAKGGGRVTKRGGPLLNAAPLIYTGQPASARRVLLPAGAGRAYGVRHRGAPLPPAPINYSGSEVRSNLRLAARGGRVYGVSQGGPNPGVAALPLHAANVWRRYPAQVHRALVGNNMLPGDGQGQTTNNIFGIYADPNYITNLCPNPGFEAGTAGWSVTDTGTRLAQDNTTALYGSQAGMVTTSGSIPGQGVYGPQGAYPFSQGLASMSCSVFGETGTIQVSFVNSNEGTVLASQMLVLNGSGWQTVNFNAIPFSSGAGLYVLITTVGSPQAITFWVDGVMYTPDGSHPTQYVDGDQANCFWTGTPELSVSYQQFQYPISSSLSFYLSGYCNAIQQGETFQVTGTPVLEFFVDPQPGATATTATIAAAFTDFGIWELTDPDPAMTYAWWTNAGTLSSQTGYQQIYGMMVPPLDYPVSGGNYAWRRAAYAAVGFKWASVPNNTEQILTDVQLEYARTSVGSATTPSAYQRARQLQVVIKPSRLNYATNPAFQVSTAGWTQVGSTVTTSISNSVWPNNLSTYDNVSYTTFQSCLVTLNGAADSGIQLSVPLLIPGETYMASCYVMPASGGLADILASCGGGAADVAGLTNPADGYGVPPYGTGPYGGVNASNTPLPQGVWTRISFPFVAATDTQTFIIAGDYLSGASAVVLPSAFPQSFYVTGLLIEPGDILMSYFDGNSGPDACWEYAGGTTAPVAGGGTVPGLSRSYYYNQLQFGQGVVANTLASNTPLGISYAAPLYATPPLQ